MTNFKLPPTATPLDIRAAFALAKVCERFAFDPHLEIMGEALQAAERYPCNFSMTEEELAHCPLLFMDEPLLVAAWNEGVEMQRAWLAELPAVMAEIQQEEAEAAEAANLERLRTMPMPTGAELLTKMRAGETVQVQYHTLGMDEDGIWIVNPYGQDAALLPKTSEACDDFIRNIRQGRVYGPTPD
jgi:hypothetical protein